MKWQWAVEILAGAELLPSCEPDLAPLGRTTPPLRSWLIWLNQSCSESSSFHFYLCSLGFFPKY